MAHLTPPDPENMQGSIIMLKHATGDISILGLEHLRILIVALNFTIPGLERDTCRGQRELDLKAPNQWGNSCRGDHLLVDTVSSDCSHRQHPNVTLCTYVLSEAGAVPWMSQVLDTAQVASSRETSAIDMQGRKEHTQTASPRPQPISCRNRCTPTLLQALWAILQHSCTK